MKTLLFMLCIMGVGLAACSSKMDPAEQRQAERYEQNRAQSVVEQVTYTKDERTGLCFAYAIHGMGNSTYALFTNVPCEPVEEYHRKRKLLN